MSNSYFLTCVDCGLSIHLGKTVYANYEGIPGTKLGFAMLGGTSSGKWLPQQSTAEEMQHFLFIHRGHELRVVPDTVQKREPYIEFAFPSDDDSSDPLFNRSAFFASGEIDFGSDRAQIDADRLPEDVVRRLKESTPE